MSESSSAVDVEVIVGKTVCLGVEAAEPVVLRLVGRWMMSGGGCRCPSEDRWTTDLELGVGVGGETEVDGRMGRAFMVRREALVSVDARCRRGGRMGAGSS